MNQARIELLKKYMDEEPNDPFNRYALACEIMYEMPEKAKEHFDLLLQSFPDYLATYYQAGTLLGELEEYEQALVVLKKGIQLAQSQGNEKTLRELMTAQQNIEFEMD